MRRQMNRGFLFTFLLLVTAAGQSFGQQGESSPADSNSSSGEQAAEVLPLAESLTDDARAEYEAGKMLYQDRDFARASLKFQQAYELSKDSRLLWNVAVCEKNLRHYSNVLRLVRQYQTEAKAMLTEADQQEAAELIQVVSSFVSPVWVSVNEVSATILVDDEVVATSPTTEPILMDMGERRIKVSKPGFRDYTQSVQVAGMSELRLTVRLEHESLEGRLLVVAGIGETIFVDGKVVGEGRWEGKVSPGRHSIRVVDTKNTNKQPYESEVEVQSKETRELRISLSKTTKEKVAGGDSTWMWIAGGTVLLAGAIVGGYFLFKPEDKTAPVSVPGTMAPGTVQMPLVHSWR